MHPAIFVRARFVIHCGNSLLSKAGCSFSFRHEPGTPNYGFGRDQSAETDGTLSPRRIECRTARMLSTQTLTLWTVFNTVAKTSFAAYQWRRYARASRRQTRQ